jgi:2-polyprenyl-3-methyl-5-hydroxy-6-metoxy-1,4-benzoquinol methylase
MNAAMAKTQVYGWAAADPYNAGYLNPAIANIARRLRPRRVLDAGCGNGALAQALAAEGWAVTGVDGDAEAIEFARQRTASVRFAICDFALSPGEQGLMDDGPYDLVVSTEVVEHLYNPQELVRFAFEALRPGGTFAVSTPYHGYLKNLALALAGKWDGHFGALWHGGHIKFWSRATLTRLLEQGGFRVVGFQGAGRLPWLWKSMILIAERPA